MRKTLQLVTLLSVACILLPSCKKETLTAKSAQSEAAFYDHEIAGTPCRLGSWQGLDDGYLRTLHYNDKGLMDSWHETAPLYGEDILIGITYDHGNKVSAVTYSDHDNLIYTVRPVYKGGRITDELWYLGNTQTLDDDIVNTYNGLGRITRRESTNYGYYVAFQYDLQGNNTIDVIKDAVSGATYDSTVQEFKKPVIEPMTLAPGMPYPIPFTNYIISPLKYSGFVEYDPDQDGNLVKTYELDKSKSVLQAGPFHFAVYYDTYNDVTGVENRQVWHYINCGIFDNNAPTTNQPAKNYIMTKGRVSMFQSTVPQMRERIMELRKLSNIRQ